MTKLIKSKEEFDAFIDDVLKQNVKDFDGGSENMWQDVYNKDIKRIKEPPTYPALLNYHTEYSSFSMWYLLKWNWITKEDLGL
jgi:hypothetical protein